MRLICPNCGAQYAIADDVIPAAGRDVQCSNCAHTWFERPGESEARDAAAEPRRPRPITGEVSSADAAPAPQPAGERRKVDPSVAGILREEAARETQKRQNEAPAAPVESQTDLGLSDPATPRRPSPETVPDKTRAAATTAAASVGAVAGAATSAEPTSRKSRLPDIEEINSSLQSQSDGSDGGTADGAAGEVRERRGFRRAFIFVLLIFAALVAVYVQADAIKAAVPALAGAVDSYVTAVDAGRIWLDEKVRDLLGPAADDTPSDG
ncbi:MAG: zinc-ribbon domain-containing protein [Pseudomonadota bacterium]